MREFTGVVLSRESLATLCEWQQEVRPLEVCALLAIDRSDEQHLLRLTNHAGLADAFEISHSEEQVLRAAADQRGWRIVAFCHTHPNHSPAMSAQDTQCFERDSLPWIIVGYAATAPEQRTFLRPTEARVMDRRQPSASQSERSRTPLASQALRR